MANRLLLYTAFHLNLAYSSIEEEDHPQVLKRCYWPLLRLAREYNLPFGIEATGCTLEAAAARDPAWVDELRHLTVEGPCEFIGSGYAQVIGPLVPTELNAANLRLGHTTYERLLGHRPQVALVNEQAYSAGLVRHYLDAGYRAIIMEWDNPASCHPEWNAEWRYLPQIACGQTGCEISLIWNKSIAFQKFQRYAHADMELDEYLDYLGRHLGDQPRAFPLYGNDVEIFDYRPGRYHTESPLIQEESEWVRLSRFFERVAADGRFQFVRPGRVLALNQQPGAGNRLHLESCGQPVPVKKQGKYNLTRWAVTGRDDLGINTACWRIYEALRANPAAGDDDWRELCFLWSSDFRTHITEKRWTAYRDRLAEFAGRVGAGEGAPKAFAFQGLGEPPKSSLHEKESGVVPPQSKAAAAATGAPCAHGNGQISGVRNLPNLIALPLEKGRVAPCPSAPCSHPRIDRCGRYLVVETDALLLKLNTRRGLAFDGLWFKGVSDQPLIGTLAHGYYDDISLGADFYTGHLVLEAPGQPKVTDLDPVEPVIEQSSLWTDITGAVRTPLGPVYKRVRIFLEAPVVDLEYRLEWKATPPGSLRMGHITLNPAAFERSALFYRTHNGGCEWEQFNLVEDAGFDHGKSVSFLVSASQGLGLTAGAVELGDNRLSVRVEVDKTTAALIGLITYRPVGGTFFYRLSLSAREIDETRRGAQPDAEANSVYRLRIAAGCRSGQSAA